MSDLDKETLKASSTPQEDLGEASSNDIIPVEPVIVLLPGTPVITPEKKKSALPSSDSPCVVKFSSQRLHQLAAARRYQYHSLDEKELQLTTNRRYTSTSTSTPLLASSEPQSPSPTSSTTNEETPRGSDMAALKRRLGERRERLGRLRRQQSAPDPRLNSTRNEHQLSKKAPPHAVKDDAEDVPTPSGSLLPSPNKDDDFKTADPITNGSPTSKTPRKNNRFNRERCQELQAHRAKYHYGGAGGALESPMMQAKIKKIESIPLSPSPQARQWLVELGRTRSTTNSPFALQSPKSFGYHKANSRKKNTECSSLLHLNHLMNGTKPAHENDRGSKVRPPSPPRGHAFEDSATTESSSVSSVCSVPSQRGGRSRLFLLAYLAVGGMVMQSGLWASREIYNSHFCPGASYDSGPRSCVRPSNRRIRDKQATLAIPQGSDNSHSVEGYAQGTPPSLGHSLWDRIESYVESEAVPEKETMPSRSKESRPKSSRRRRGSQPKFIMDQNLSLESWNVTTSQAESYDFESVFDLSRSVNRISLPCRNRVNISSRIVPQRTGYRRMQAWTAASFANEVAFQCSDNQDETGSSMWGGVCLVPHDDNKTFTADVVSQQADQNQQNTTSSEEQPGCTLVPPAIESGLLRDGWIYFNTPWIADGVFQANTDFFRQASAQHVIQPCTLEKRVVNQQPLLANIFTRFGKFLRKQQDRVDQILQRLRTIEMDKVEALLQI